MKNDIDISIANKNDLPEIIAMAKEMADYHRSLDKYYKPAESYKNLEQDFEKELSDANILFLAAAKNGNMVGYFRGAVESAPTYASPKKIGVIYDIYVKENYRKQGVGELLMKEVLDWFKSKNVKNIELSVDGRNASAINFWKKFEFFEYKLRLRKDI